MANEPPALSLADARIMAGDEVLAALVAEPVALSLPEQLRVPFVFASPHSGHLYPLRLLLRGGRLDALALRKSEDAFVDELFASAVQLGAPLLAARFPRVFVDVNRAPGEIDPAMFDGPVPVPVEARTARVSAGLGVIPRVVREGMEIYRTKLPPAEAAFRLNHFHRPYHAALHGLLEAAKAQFGVAILIDCHSMPGSPRGSEIVVGDCYGDSATAELSGAVHRIFHRSGFTVARNAPYAGGYSTRRYGKPETGVQAVQIELSRGLYMDEARLTRLSRFGEVKDKLARATGMLLSASGPWLLPRSSAAAAAE